MAWIESHQELRHHYKTKRLARELKVTVAAAVGHLHFLWWWAVDFAPDGDLSKFDDVEIADAIGYEGKDPSKAKAALISAGFLDNSEHRALMIHDWQEYAGRTLIQREKARTRAKNHREKQSAQGTGNVQQQAAHGTQRAAVTQAQTTDSERTEYANGTHTLRERNADGTDSEPVAYASTEHNITEHNNTVQESTVQETTPPLPPVTGGSGEGVQEKPPTAIEARFEEFWKAYPKKQGKGAALKAWKKIKPDRTLHETIMAAVRANTDRNQQWQRDGGQYIPNPTTWLNQQRWLDEIPEQPQRGDAANGTGYQRIGGADDYHDFQRSTGFRSADSDTDPDS